MHSRANVLLIGGHLLLAMTALVGLTLWPPRSGAMLLIPLPGSDGDGVVAAAIDGGAVLIGPGPLAGSIIVAGDRSRIADRLAAGPAIIMAAPPGGCGDPAGRVPT